MDKTDGSKWKAKLRDEHCYLMRELPHWIDEIMDYLYNRKILSLEMFIEVMTLRTKQAKTRKLLFMLTINGEQGYSHFCDSLLRLSLFDVYEKMKCAN